MIPDAFQQKTRIEKAIARMCVDYQNQGAYLDLNGKTHNDSEGIVDAMGELEAMENYLKRTQ